MHLLLLLGLMGCVASGPAEPPPESPRLRRLSHLQWQTSVRSLLHLTEAPEAADSFLTDPAIGRFDNDAAAMFVTRPLQQQYEEAVNDIAYEVVTTPELYEQVVGGLERDAWLKTFGRRAFRRPLSARELAAWQQLFSAGNTFSDGVQASIVAFLLSPAFIYRIEDIERPDAVSSDPPDGYEKAANLSLSLWNRGPDDALLDAAAGGLTDAEFEKHAKRLLSKVQTRESFLDFHRQLFRLESYVATRKAEGQFPEFSLSRTPHSMLMETELFLDHHVSTDGTLSDLLTSKHSFANSDLGPIYGLTLPSREFEPVELPEGRGGILTLSGFLASNAGPLEPSMIGRGHFVAEELLCADLSAPPPGATPVPRESEEGSLRTRTESHTGACGGACHNDWINPLGGAFDGFDAIGAMRESDRGYAIDSTGSVPVLRKGATFDGAEELSVWLAESPLVHRCYVEHLSSYFLGRSLVDEDESMVNELTAKSWLHGASMKELALDVVRADAKRRD